MISYPLIDQLRQLKLCSMADCLGDQMKMKDIINNSFEDRLGVMSDG